MNRILASITFLALLLLGFPVSATVQPDEVEAYSEYEANLAKAALFLNSTQFDSTTGLCREAPFVHNDTFWLVSDNLLAYHALQYYYPETAEVVRSTMLYYGYFRSFKHEVVFGTTIPHVPFRTNNTYKVAQNGTMIKTEVFNGSFIDDYKKYADLCIYAALHFYWKGDITNATDHFNTAKSMWNNTLHGVYDKASKAAENNSSRLIFSTYKLSLLLYCSRILNQTLEDRNSIEETLWLMQDGTGGLHTDYDINLNYTGSDVNTETTSAAILAYKYSPEIVNRPLQHQASLGNPPDYQKMQEAVSLANIADTIFVYRGIYHENVIMNKSVSLIGQDPRSTILDGNNSGHVVSIVSDNVTVAGFTVQRGGSTMFPNFDAGISVNSARGCTIAENNIVDNGCFGIHLLDSNKNTVIENNLTRNTMYAIDLTTSSGNTISSNTALFNSNIGIAMHASSQYNIITGNAITNNTCGIDVARASNNVISYNNLTNNSAAGVWIQDNAINNTVLSNSISQNGYGFYIDHSSGNTIWRNDIVDNDIQVFIGSGSANKWDDGYPEGGNYWSDFEARYPLAEDRESGPHQNETGGDSIWDSPYVIDSNNTDNYPTVPEFPSFLILPLFMIATLTAIIVCRRKHQRDSAYANDDHVVTATERPQSGE